MSRLVVWYNSRCPVCDAGITRQRNQLIAAVEAGELAFHDINLPNRMRSQLMASRSTTSVAGFTPPMDPAASSSAPMLRSQSGGCRRVSAGSPPFSAIRSLRPVTRFVYDRFADLSTPGTGAEGIGELRNDDLILRAKPNVRSKRSA